jgi:hypothetical protein
MGSYQEKRGELCTFIKKVSSSRQGIVCLVSWLDSWTSAYFDTGQLYIIRTHKYIGHDYYNDMDIPTLWALLLSGKDKQEGQKKKKKIYRYQKNTKCGCPE